MKSAAQATAPSSRAIRTNSSKVTSESWVLEADDPTGEFRVIAPREQDVEYDIEHHGDRFLIVTNADGAENFKLVEAPEASPGRDHWVDVVPHRPDRVLQLRVIALLSLAGGLLLCLLALPP